MHLLLGALSLALLTLAYGEPCSFPEYMQAHIWESRIRSERRDVSLYISFTDRQMTSTDYEEIDPKEEKSQCVVQLPEEKYIVTETNEGGEEGYKCVQFVKRSPYVVQIRSSVSMRDLLQDTLCSDENLILETMPLVYPRAETEYVQCPLVGGYDFKIWDNKANEYVCDPIVIHPRIESECLEGEGITMDFRSPDCRGSLGMRLIQKLACLGGWEQDGHTYMIMTDRNDLWPKLWLMKYHHEGETEIKATLVKDIDTLVENLMTAGKTTYEITMTLKQYPSLCEDESDNCNECNGYDDFYCQKSCGICQSLLTQESCSFLGDTRGEWIESTIRGNKDIRVTTSMIYNQNFSNFECINMDVDLWFENSYRNALTSVFRNGCKPRYTCVEMTRISTSVMQYRLGQSIVWPHTSEINAREVCSPTKFKDDSIPLRNTHRNEYPKNLVIKKSRNRRRSTVPCQLPGKFHITAEYLDGSNCTGTIMEDCNTDHTMKMALEGGCNAAPAQAFNCLASYHKYLKYYIVTESKEDPSNVQCWVYDEDIYEGENNRLYLVPASECNKFTKSAIEYKGLKNYIALFDYSMVPRVCSVTTNKEIPASKPPTAETPVVTTITATPPTTPQKDSNLTEVDSNKDSDGTTSRPHAMDKYSAAFSTFEETTAESMNSTTTAQQLTTTTSKETTSTTRIVEQPSSTTTTSQQVPSKSTINPGGSTTTTVTDSDKPVTTTTTAASSERPTTTTPSTTSSERPTTTTPSTTSSERPTTTTPSTTSSDRPTTTTPGISDRPTTTTPGISDKPTPTTPVISERPPTTTSSTTSSDRPTTTTLGISDRPTTTTPSTTSSDRPTTTTPGISDRPTTTTPSTTSSDRPTTSTPSTTSSDRPTTTTLSNKPGETTAKNTETVTEEEQQKESTEQQEGTKYAFVPVEVTTEPFNYNDNKVVAGKSTSGGNSLFITFSAFLILFIHILNVW